MLFYNESVPTSLVSALLYIYAPRLSSVKIGGWKNIFWPRYSPCSFYNSQGLVILELCENANARLSLMFRRLFEIFLYVGNTLTIQHLNWPKNGVSSSILQLITFRTVFLRVGGATGTHIGVPVNTVRVLQSGLCLMVLHNPNDPIESYVAKKGYCCSLMLCVVHLPLGATFFFFSEKVSWEADVYELCKDEWLKSLRDTAFVLF